MTQTKPLYRLYDIYNCDPLDADNNRIRIGEYQTLLQAQQAARLWDIEETDGECCIIAYRYNPETGKYHRDHSFKY